MTSISLYDLLTEVSGAIKNQFPKSYWVRAEISNIKVGQTTYIDLSNCDSEQQAKARGVIFANQLGILEKFRSETGSPLSNGMKILVRVGVNYHPVYGLSLNVKEIDSGFTIGEMELRLKQIREQLESKGFSNLNRHLVSPPDFTRVAVIAPENAAGLGDFMVIANILEKEGLCTFKYFEAKFQGDKNEKSIIDSMASIVRENKTHQFDAVCIIRGGGDKDGLYELNRYKLALGVCRLPIPVITGIGHKQDKTVLDEFANISLPTPSLVITHIRDRILSNAQTAKRNQIALVSHIEGLLARKRAELQDNFSNVMSFAQARTIEQRGRVEQFHTFFTQRPNEHLSQMKSEIIRCKTGLFSGSGVILDRATSQTGREHGGMIHRANADLSKTKTFCRDSSQTLKSDARRLVYEQKTQVQQCHLQISEKPSQKILQIKLDMKSEVESLFNSSKHIVERAASHSNRSKDLLTHGFKLLLSSARESNLRAETQIRSSAQKKMYEQTVNVNRMQGLLSDRSSQQLSQLAKDLSRHKYDFFKDSQRIIARAKIHTEKERQTLALLDPVNIVNRGYAILRDESRQVVTDVDALAANKFIKISMRDGSATANIKEVMKKNE